MFRMRTCNINLLNVLQILGVAGDDSSTSRFRGQTILFVLGTSVFSLYFNHEVLVLIMKSFHLFQIVQTQTTAVKCRILPTMYPHIYFICHFDFVRRPWVW
jgi:hypothetical protein